MRPGLRMLLCCLPVLGVPLFAAAEVPTSDPRWAKAQSAYDAGHKDEGHSLLIELAESHPGHLDLAVACYSTILEEEGRLLKSNPWIDLAAGRLVALEQVGAISANTRSIHEAVPRFIDKALQDGQQLEARETTDRLYRENPNDLYWRIRQAYNYRRMDLLDTLPLYQKLKEDLDPDHPHPYTRELWSWMDNELKIIEKLPHPIYPLPEGTPLALMSPDDPDGYWRTVLDRSPADIPIQVDRVAALARNQIIPWQDQTGLTDPLRALDLHLQSKPAAELAALRTLQDDLFARERLPNQPKEADLLSLSRRFAWSAEVHRKLLAVANEALWEGRSESALRSFREILTHSADPALRDAAQVGAWTALKLIGAFGELRAFADAIDPGKTYPWMGKTAKGAQIRAELRKGVTTPPPTQAPSLKGLSQHVLQLPPVSPWPTDTPAIGFGIDLQIAGSQIIASGRNLLVSYDANDPGTPLWSHLQPHPIEHHRHTGFHPGYFRPLILDDTLYTRWGLTSLPNGIAAFELAGGQPLWSYGYDRGRSPYSSGVPMGDPVAADGGLFYLQWHTPGGVTDRNRTVSLIHFDPNERRPRWSADLVSAGRAADISGSMQRSAPQNTIYGNAVTVHRGAVYCNTNAGMIIRCDVRDGRVDWIHNYRRQNSSLVPENLGAKPIISGSMVICMPRDDGRIFALDQDTGLLVWDNPLVMGTEMIGVSGHTLVVRGAGVLSGLDIKTGIARWFRPLPLGALGRALLRGDSVYLGSVSEVTRIEALTGKALERRPWALGEARPLAFTIAHNRIFVMSDNPAPDRRHNIGEPLARIKASPASLKLPLRRTWSLTRSDARIALAPASSGLRDTAYLLSGGILECLDLSPSGSIKWRRFVDAHNASLSFVGEKLFLVENGRSRRGRNRAVALSARNGRFLWEAPVPSALGNPFFFGTRIMYHDRRGKMVVLDLENGIQAWERTLNEGHLVDPYWDGQNLNIFHASKWHGPHHLVLDPATGRTIRRNRIIVANTPSANLARPLENGWFEVRFPARTASWVRLTALSEVNGGGWASAAELHVLDEKGNPLPRDKWIIEAEHERNNGLRALPPNLIDGDPATWWHSPWKHPDKPAIGKIVPHPHFIHINLGAHHRVSGFQYLPARINNNNGMIRDYEFHARKDTDPDWGEPVAAGILVNRLHVDRNHFGPGAVFFDARNYPGNKQTVFRYNLDGQAAQPVEEEGHLLSTHGRYALITSKNKLILRRSDDPNYRFELTPHIEHGRHGDIVIEGDRLIMGRHKIAIADLNAKRFLEIPEDPKSRRHQNGNFVRLQDGHFLKIVHHGNKQELALINMTTGHITEGVLETQVERFTEDRFLKPPRQRLLTFDRTLLFYDNSTLSAWVAAN